VAQRSGKLLAGQSERERALADRGTVLRPAGPAQLVKLSLSPEEGFVVSRIDRAMPLSDVLLVCGLPEAHGLQVLLNLMTKGALLLPGEKREDESETVTSPVDDVVFSPVDLQEDVDLDFERRKQILYLFHHIDQMSHYRLLGIAPTATDVEVRKAYLERSRQFHPDTFFRKRLGSYQAKVEAIFQRAKIAHDVLMDADARLRYDRESRRLFTNDETSALVQREITSLEDEQRQKLRRGSLLRARGFAKLTRARDLLAQGDAALAQGNAKAAITCYQEAFELDPRLEEARLKIAEARKLALKQRADLAIDAASRAENEGNFNRAIELLKSAQELDATNSRIYSALPRRQVRQDPPAPR
jgi:curved DNA-binding protein CbpA